MEPADPVRRRVNRLRWAVFLSGTIGYSLYYVCRLSLSVVKVPLVQDGVLTESQLGLVGSGLFYAYAVGKLVNGFLADRANINHFITIGLFGTAMVNLILGFNPGFLLFAVLWLVSGWFQSMGAPSCIVGLSRWFNRTERGTYYGWWSASHNIGEGLTFIAVATLSSHFGWRWGFWGAATAGFVGAVGVLGWFHNRPPEPAGSSVPSRAGAERLSPAEKQRVREAQWLALRNPIIWLIAAASAFMYVARYAINSWGVFFLELEKGYPRIEAGAIISISSAAGIVGTIASGWVSDRWFSDNRFLPSFLAGLLNALSLAVFLAVPGGNPWVDYACMVGFGFSIGALICYLGGLLAIDTVPRESAGAALGIVGIASYLGAGIQDTASGYLIEAGKTGIGSVARYDFVPASLLWMGAAVTSTLITAMIWHRSRQLPVAPGAL
jgi:OPA family sugar phosphate sensor protein UhpC-like MFS transporter